MNALVVGSAFLAAAVEWVEALTIVLAVGLYRGWRSAFAGIAAAVVALAALAAAVSGLIGNHGALSTIRTLVGAALLLFGVRWLHKAILRAAGLKAVHDEAAAFESTGSRLRVTTATGRLDRVGVLTAFGGVFLEGLEVIFIVVALGNLHGMASPVIGAAAALVVVAATGFTVRRPLTRVPENAMKFVVGVMLSAFGTFFAGEGLHASWWHGDVSILLLVSGYAAFAVAAVALCRRPPAPEVGRHRSLAWATAAAREVWGLFIDNGPLALLTVIALLSIAYVAKAGGRGHPSGFWLAAGVAAALTVTLAPARRTRPRPPAPAPPSRPDVPAGEPERTSV